MENTKIETRTDNEFYRQFIIGREALAMLERQNETSEQNAAVVQWNNNPNSSQVSSTVRLIPGAGSLEGITTYVSQLTYNTTPLLKTLAGHVIALGSQNNNAEQLHEKVLQSFENLNTKRKETLERRARLASYDEIFEEDL